MKALYVKMYVEDNTYYFEIDTDTIQVSPPPIEIILTDGEKDYTFNLNSTINETVIKFYISISSIKNNIKENFTIKSPLKINIIKDLITSIEIETNDIFNNYFDNTLTGEIDYIHFDLWRASPLIGNVDIFRNYITALPEYFNTVQYSLNLLELPSALDPKTITTSELSTTINNLTINESGTVYFVSDAPLTTRVAIPIITEDTKEWKRLNFSQLYTINIINNDQSDVYFSRVKAVKMILNAESKTFPYLNKVNIISQHFNSEIQNYIEPVDNIYNIKNFTYDQTLTKPYIYDEINTRIY